MITTERFFGGIWSFWFLLVMFSAFTLGLAPKIVFVPMAVVTVMVFCWCVKCAYRSERFADYASLRLCFSLSVGPLIAFILALAMTYKKARMGGVQALALSSLPLVLTALACAWAHGRKSKSSVWVLRGDRVEVYGQAENVNPWLLGGLSAGLSSVLFPMIKAYDESAAFLLSVLTLISLYMVFYHRHNIAALRALKERERREKRHYTFSDIEYVRGLREASWLARIFARGTRR